jgi:hypothetical protein
MMGTRKLEPGDLVKLRCDEVLHDPDWIPGDPHRQRLLPRGELVTIVEPPAPPWFSVLVLHPARGLGRVFGSSLSRVEEVAPS